MAAHTWTESDDGVEVRHVQPYQALKRYTCPGCRRGNIDVGVGHKVVVPDDAPQDRRHWHTGCWHKEEKRTAKRR